MLLVATLAASTRVAPGRGSAADGAPRTADDVVTELYDLVTFEAGTTPDWDKVRALFLESAIVVLRTGPAESTIFSLEGFVDDFVSFIEEADAANTGFTETILCRETMVYRDIAHILVLFESSIPGSGEPPRPGIDSFQLVRIDGDWRIVSVTNDRPGDGFPIEGVFPADCRPPRP